MTGNGLDESHLNFPKPDAAAFIALDRRTGAVLWTDRDHGKNVLHGSWSSPSYAVLGGRPQVLFPGGDCWLYSFDPAGDGKGSSKLLWKFDCNPKSARYVLGGRGRRNEYITTPVVWNGRVYVATGQDCEHGGEGGADLWCLDPAKRLNGSDVSAELVTGSSDGMPKEFVRSGAPADRIKPNPHSAVVWRYTGKDLDGDGKLAVEETMNRTLAHVSISAGLLFAADFCGIVHCLDAETGKVHWTHDMYSTCWLGPPLIVDGKAYVCDEDGDVTIFRLSREKTIIAERNMQSAMYTAPIIANGVFYIANKSQLFAIAKGAQSEPLGVEH